MDKINSGFFNISNTNFRIFNVEFQPELFVKVPKKTQVKGKLSKSFLFIKQFP